MKLFSKMCEICKAGLKHAKRMRKDINSVKFPHTKVQAKRRGMNEAATKKNDMKGDTY